MVTSMIPNVYARAISNGVLAFDAPILSYEVPVFGSFFPRKLKIANILSKPYPLYKFHRG